MPVCLLLCFDHPVIYLGNIQYVYRHTSHYSVRFYHKEVAISVINQKSNDAEFPEAIHANQGWGFFDKKEERRILYYWAKDLENIYIYLFLFVCRDYMLLSEVAWVSKLSNWKLSLILCKKESSAKIPFDF